MDKNPDVFSRVGIVAIVVFLFCMILYERPEKEPEPFTKETQVILMRINNLDRAISGQLQAIRDEIASRTLTPPVVDREERILLIPPIDTTTTTEWTCPRCGGKHWCPWIQTTIRPDRFSIGPRDPGICPRCGVALKELNPGQVMLTNPALICLECPKCGAHVDQRLSDEPITFRTDDGWGEK